MAPHHPRSTPARLTAPATAKLPRLYLLLLGIIYIFAGLYFRDPWKTDDIVGLATMLTALNGPDQAAWLPQIGSFAHAQDGPLAMWVGAAFISVFTPVFTLFTQTLDAQIIASRLPNLLWFGLMVGAVWYATYLLGRRPEPQPLRLPFGGEPTERDYGRMIADASLLLILATAGIMWRMHETSEVPVIIAVQAVAFYSVVRMLDRPLSGAITLGLAIGAALLARGWIGALPIYLAIATAFLPTPVLRARLKWLGLSVLIGTLLCLAWWVPAQSLNPYWAQYWWLWNIESFTFPSWREVFSIFRDLPWFLWPTWPFALMALWQWRSWLRAPHVWLPLMFALWPFVTMLFLADSFEPEYSLMAVPFAVMAAFALPTLRRGMVNSLDWFAVMCFSLTIATVWLGWVALQAGWPEQISDNIARQTEGYDAYVSWPAVTIALAGTVAWLVLVRWRVLHRPAALWRGTVLSAGGIVTTWLLLVTLWMPALDYVRSYRDVSNSLNQAIETHQRNNECVQAIELGVGQRAAFYVFNGLDPTSNRNCALAIIQTSPQALDAGMHPLGNMNVTLLWEGKRRPERRELFQLVRIHAQ
ncbi:ArnT family glycosyltransferase [Neopusillimonas maritima]|uniref:Glycosyltransferase n=1 Tax=Neopusillimonas maritima TaxID=2026239 RepID=A0A3A1YXY7_9BURK|nr:glycosyltransferase [Neopusillimonas maritima]RIY40937.1 glycosyltransferase [Neopusillimonas maritima]